MKSIAYIIPYFGKLPKNFPLWLLGCKCNPTVNWIILTDDRTIYDYPSNVKVFYTSYQNVVNRFKKHFDFEVLIDRPWRLSLFKPAYGEIFEKELQGYDFWGYCDIDLMWGNIRKFYTNDVLDQYDRVGFLGHSTLYRNTKENYNGTIQISLIDDKQLNEDYYCNEAKNIIRTKYANCEVTYDDISIYLLEHSMLRKGQILRGVIKPLIKEGKIEKLN